MDIERMKKINQMIPELKKQGFAVNSSEAAVQSDQIFRNAQGDDIITRSAHAEPAIHDAPSTSLDDHPTMEKAPEVSESGSVVGAVHPDMLLQVQKLEDRMSTVESQIDNVIAKMNEMIMVITKLEKSAEGGAMSSAPKETQQKIAPKGESKTQPHARSGNYTSTDVDINKIFYYGNK